MITTNDILTRLRNGESMDAIGQSIADVLNEARVHMMLSWKLLSRPRPQTLWQLRSASWLKISFTWCRIMVIWFAPVLVTSCLSTPMKTWTR